MRNDLEVSTRDQELGVGISTIMSYLLAVGGPFLIILVSVAVPLHYAVEEGWKLIIIWSMTRSLRERMGVGQALVIGVLFGLTELVLFVINALLTDDMGMLIDRLIFTVSMHGMTAALIYIIGRRGRAWWIVGLVAAIILHGGFNYSVK